METKHHASIGIPVQRPPDFTYVDMEDIYNHSECFWIISSRQRLDSEVLAESYLMALAKGILDEVLGPKSYENAGVDVLDDPVSLNLFLDDLMKSFPWPVVWKQSFRKENIGL